DPDGRVADTRVPWSAFEASLDRKLRENLRRRMRKLQSGHGPVEVRVAANREQLAQVRDALDAANTRARSFREGGGLRPFHWALMTAAVVEGALDLAMLAAGGVVIAFEVNFKLDRRVTSLAIGYDEGFAEYGPGQLLRAEVLKRYCDAGDVDSYDFMAGGAS